MTNVDEMHLEWADPFGDVGRQFRNKLFYIDQ